MIRWLCLLLCLSVIGTDPSLASPIARENTFPGTRDWEITPVEAATFGIEPRQTDTLTYTTAYPFTGADGKRKGIPVQGYASRTGVAPGESITFHVSSVTPQYRLQIYRLGWYDGLGGRLLHDSGVLAGAAPQPVPTLGNEGLAECDWPASHTVVVAPSWTTGVYLAKLSTVGASPHEFEHYVSFVVRDPSRTAPIVFVSAVATHQAYNEWGGSSLYDGANPRKVSFRRPQFRARGGGDFLSFEIQTLRWLEREGFDVEYATDVDLHADPTLLEGRAAVLVPGHSEYWSATMRASAERARDRGVSLGFLTANAVYWQIRFEPAGDGTPNRTIVGYKDRDLTNPRDPYLAGPQTLPIPHPQSRRFGTTWWSNFDKTLAGQPINPAFDPVNRPESGLLGVEFEGDPFTPYQPWTIADDAPAWLLAGTGLVAGDSIDGIVGYEVDRRKRHHPETLEIVAASDWPAPPGSLSHGTIYEAPSGAIVFASGTIGWGRGLDDYEYQTPETPHGTLHGGVQQITRNFLERAQTVPYRPRSRRLEAEIVPDPVPGFPAEHAVDGDPMSLWLAAGTPSPTNNHASFVVDLGTTRWLHRLRWLGADDGAPYDADSPTDYTIAVSGDRRFWKTVVTRSGGGETVVDGDELLNESGRYVRLSTQLVGDGTGRPLGLFELWVEGTDLPPTTRLRALSYSASSAAPGYSVGRVGDHDESTVWTASTTPNSSNNQAWIRLDFGSSRSFHGVSWIGAHNDPYPTSSPTDFEVYSHDGSSSVGALEPIYTRSGEARLTDAALPLTGRGRYLELVTTEVNDGTGWSLGFREFWARGSDAASVLAANVVAVSGEMPGHPAEHALDHDPTTFWMESVPFSGWICLDLGTERQVHRIRWRGVSAESSPTRYRISVGDDCQPATVAELDRTRTIRIVEGADELDARGRYVVFEVPQQGTAPWHLALREIWVEGY